MTERPLLARLSTIFPPVTLAIAIFVTFLSWSIASPPGSTPDEAYHVGNAWCVFGESNDCTILNSTEGGYRWARVPFSVDLCFKRGPEIPASCIADQRPDTQVVPIDNVTRMYPPHFYVVGNLLLSLFRDGGILALRIFNGALFAALLAVALRLATRAVQRALVATTLIFLVPQGIFLVASVNPSSWSFTGVLTSWAFLATFFARFQEGKIIASRVALCCWVLSIVISAARYDSLVYSAVLSIAVTVSHVRWLWGRAKPFLVGVGLISITSIVLARGFLISITRRTIDMFSDPGFFSFARYWLIHYLEIPFTSMGLNYGTYGPTGSLDVLTPPLVGHIQFALLAGALFWGLRERNRLQRVFLSSFLVVLYFLILQEVSRSHETGFYLVQGRYFLPFMAGSVGIVLAASSSRTSLLDFPALRSLIVGFVSIANALALFAIVRRYSYGTTNDYKRFEIDVDKNFSLPDGWRYVSFLSPRAVLIGGSIAFAIATWIIVTMLNTDDEPDKPSERLVQET